MSEEKEILEALAKGRLKRAKNAAHEIEMAKEAANNYLRKNSRINIRLPGADLKHIKQIAVQEGLPYQTLISSVLHKFASGRLVGKS